MDWLTQNAFQLIGLAVSTGSAVWAASKAYYSLDNRIRNVENDMMRMDKKLDEDLERLQLVVSELKADIKKLTEFLINK
jgi:hypothetical protein